MKNLSKMACGHNSEGTIHSLKFLEIMLFFTVAMVVPLALDILEIVGYSIFKNASLK